jgi:hypothetical protein
MFKVIVTTSLLFIIIFSCTDPKNKVSRESNSHPNAYIDSINYRKPISIESLNYFFKSIGDYDNKLNLKNSGADSISLYRVNSDIVLSIKNKEDIVYGIISFKNSNRILPEIFFDPNSTGFDENIPNTNIGKIGWDSDNLSMILDYDVLTINGNRHLKGSTRIEIINKLRELYVGNSIFLDSIEVAEFDLPESTSFLQAMLICQDLGEGWRLPSRSEMIKIYNSVKVKNINRHTSGGYQGEYWINEFKEMKDVAAGQLQTASYLKFYYVQSELDHGYVGATYNSRIVRTKKEFLTKDDSARFNSEYEIKQGGGLLGGGEYLSK